MLIISSTLMNGLDPSLPTRMREAVGAYSRHVLHAAGGIEYRRS